MVRGFADTLIIISTNTDTFALAPISLRTNLFLTQAMEMMEKVAANPAFATATEAKAAGDPGKVFVGFGRIVVSEIEVPILLVDLVSSG